MLWTTLALCAAAGGGGDAPRLVVVVSVDQLRPDQLARLGPALEGGLGRMVREGMEFRAATLDYAATETGPGHATLATGCLPRTHGIVGNDFWLIAEQRSAYCMEQPGGDRVTSGGAIETAPTHGRGPAHLRVPTLAEHVRAAHPGAQVVSIAGKDRSAIGMQGRAPGAALWWDRGDGGFTSTTAYGAALPDWVARWNETWVELCSGREWAPLAVPDLDELGTAVDDREGEAVFGPFGRGFPYRLHAVEDPESRDDVGRLAALVYASPFVDECVARLAREAIVHLALGADDAPDVLNLSFSATDTVGHANGPYSCEATDVVLRVDRDLGALFALCDERVGAGRWTAALSADHGVLPLPEHMAASFVGARRVGTGELRATQARVRAALEERYGEHLEKRFNGEGVALDHARAAELGVDLVEARALARDAALASIGAGSWLGGAYTLDELAVAARGEGSPGDPWRPLFVASFDAERSYDVVFRNAPWTLLGRGTGTSHGSCYPYDREVPLLFLGAGVPQGVRSDRAGSHDVTPTLLAILGVRPLRPLDGRDLFPRAR